MKPKRLKKLLRITQQPEFDVIVFSFLLHFAWEILQAPLFSSLDDVAHWAGIKTCLWATFGDVGLALAAYLLTAVVSSGRRWVYAPQRSEVLLFLTVGILVTIGVEFYSTQMSMRWIYAPNMIRIPFVGVGLSPLLQWVVVPLLVVFFTGRRR